MLEKGIGRPDGTVTKETRVMLFDVNDVFICAWVGYKLPDFLGIELNNEIKWPNKNASMPYMLRWVYDADPKLWIVQSFNFPLGMAIQTELAMVARL